jgi:hypothetical protein
LISTRFIFAQEKLWTKLSIPDQINVNQKIEKCPEGWQDYTHGIAYTVKYVTIFDGRPEKLASLEPDSEVINRQTKIGTSIYKLNAGVDDATWVACSYTDTSIKICRQLPMGTKIVKVTFSVTMPNNPKIIKVEFQ